ncbi:MAG: ABC transporter permease subunit [Chloroflexota bacterium]|nr:ABC transporter permease subunit [Chloroflexota bacterium]
MRDIALITTASIRNNLGSKVVMALAIAVVLICIVGTVLALCLLLIAPAMEAELPDRTAMEAYLGVVVYAVCLVGLGVNLNAFGFQTMTREKSRGSMAALLATPLKASHIWTAKSLAVFLPGLVLGVVLALIALVAVNYAYFVPTLGFLFTPWIAISSFVALPLIYLSLSLLVHVIGLTGNPATGNVIVQVFLPVFAALIINLVVHGVLDAASWPFTLANLGLAVVIGIIAFLLRTRLTRERIVLSR